MHQAAKEGTTTLIVGALIRDLRQLNLPGEFRVFSVLVVADAPLVRCTLYFSIPLHADFCLQAFTRFAP